MAHALAQHRDGRCQATHAEMVAALTGNYRPEHLFVLTQNLELFDTCQTQIAACDTATEAHMRTLIAAVDTPAPPLPTARVTRKPRQHEPRFEIRTPLHQLTGVDLTQIDGIASYTALKLVAEIGTDMRRWPSEKHFTSWLTLAPNNKVSGGRLLSARTQPSANRAAAILRMAAMSLGRTQTALGAFYRRLAFRVGKARRLPRPLGSWLSWSIALSKATWSIATPAPTPMMPTNTPGCYGTSANAPQPSALRSSIARLARYLREQFLRSRGSRVRVAAGAPSPKGS